MTHEAVVDMGKWSAAVMAIVAAVTFLVTKFESDPKAMPIVQEISDRLAGIEDNLHEEQERQIELLREQNEYLERQQQEHDRTHPPTTSQPWPADPYPTNPPPGYYDKRPPPPPSHQSSAPPPVAKCWDGHQWGPCY